MMTIFVCVSYCILEFKQYLTNNSWLTHTWLNEQRNHCRANKAQTNVSSRYMQQEIKQPIPRVLSSTRIFEVGDAMEDEDETECEK